ncbi:hypothetical protein ONA91_31800 [Micromonospora sp. DR5-3]|uniref:FIMAH domain-containing protein n=1 Tax=unclassified Micromonospora TaxID=2617518 RepID=UPI0011D6BD76|nr:MULTISPECIES: hypothetical protein [unclassified Micromonospora]MCW3819032.1 hypothetical protein [Micromonospora sp. DR5-3]TYC19758.1 hypothetical protein FXF52_34955 [Micromonospora sp. MP36]
MRWFMWAAVAGAVAAVVLAAVALMFAGGDPEPAGAGSAPAIPAATDAAVSEAAESQVTDAPSASPSSSPSVKPSPRPTLRPMDVIAGLHTTVRELVQDGQLKPDAGEDLTKRLKDAAEKLADGEVDKARDKLEEFGKKVAKLREENKLSSAGYQTLAAGLAQLAALLPSR